MIHTIASSRIGAKCFSPLQHHLDRGFLKLTGGRRTLTSIVSGLPVVMLTTTGARSGKSRTVPLLCIQRGNSADQFAIIASNWGQKHHPAWYHNLKADPRARCSFGKWTGQYSAHEATGEEYRAFWQCAMDTYPGFPLYQKRAGDRHIPIFVMTAVDESGFEERNHLK